MERQFPNLLGFLPQTSHQTDVVLRGVWVSIMYSNVLINLIAIPVQMKSLRQRFRWLFVCSNKVQGSLGPTLSAATKTSVKIPLQLMNQNSLSFPTLSVLRTA